MDDHRFWPKHLFGKSSRLWRKLPYFTFVVIFVFGLFFRLGGVNRGLNSRTYCYHPDSPKQVRAVGHYLSGHYIWYTGSWFSDGYPYGLNQVDALLLRPILALRLHLYCLLNL
jgi:hypothetical protein